MFYCVVLICCTNYNVLFQSEKDRCEMEVEVEHLKSAGGKQTLTSASKIRLSEMRLKREVTQLKQQILLVACVPNNFFPSSTFVKVYYCHTIVSS